MPGTLNEMPWEDKEVAGLLARLRRRKWLFVSVFVLVAGLAGLIYWILPPRYLADGAVTITAYGAQIGGDVSPAAELKLGDPADMDSQIIIAKSPRLMQDMLRRSEVVHALYQDCEARRQDQPVNRLRALAGELLGPVASCETALAGTAASDWLQRHFIISGAGRSRIIRIGYESPVPEAAATLVNGLIDAYLAQATADRLRSRTEAAAWIEAEIGRIGGSLHQSELGLEDFRRDHGLVRGQTASIASERLSQLSQQLTAAEAAKSDAAAKLDQLRNGASDARATLESRTIADLKQQLATVSGQIARMSATYRRNNAAMAPLIQQRNDIQRHIADETNRIRTSLQNDYASAATQADALRTQMKGLEHDVGVGDMAETQIASMVRDDDVKRELYAYLSKKANDLEAQRRLLTGNVELVNYAQVPTLIAFPKVPLFALAGLVLGTVAASAAALMRDRSDSAVRSSGRLEALAGARVLGLIPRLRRRRGSYARTAGSELGRPSALQEAVRSLYAKCVLLNGAARPRTILLSSANSGEGKSFLTLAMAQFGAATGQRVLVVEGDLRRPSFRTALNLPDGPGLVEILRGTAGSYGAIRSTAFGFDIVCAGAATVASTELLSNGSIAAFLEWARDSYDLVLIDSPPAQVLMDAHVLASLVDGVLCCVRWGHSSVEVVAESVDSLRQAGGHVIGLAVGMVQPSEYRLYEPVKLLERPYLMASS